MKQSKKASNSAPLPPDKGRKHAAHDTASLVWDAGGVAVYGGAAGFGGSVCPPPERAIILDLVGRYGPVVRGVGIKLPASLSHPIVTIAWADMSAPVLSPGEWRLIIDTVWRVAKRERRPVLVACSAGHGRTGTALGIIACHLGLIPEDTCPVQWVRERYCQDAVETTAQGDYIDRVTGRKVTTVIKAPLAPLGALNGESKVYSSYDYYTPTPQTPAKKAPAPLCPARDNRTCFTRGKGYHLCGLVAAHPNDHKCEGCLETWERREK